MKEKYDKEPSLRRSKPMNNMITAEQVDEIVNDEYDSREYKEGLEVLAYERAIDRIKSLLPAERKWISVDDELPEANMDVWIMANGWRNPRMAVGESVIIWRKELPERHAYWCERYIDTPPPFNYGTEEQE